MTDAFDERLAIGIAQLEAKIVDLERFLAGLSAGVSPEPDALATARHDVANMEAAVKSLRRLMDRRTTPGR